MRVSIALSAFLALRCYGADTVTADSSHIENIYGAYEVDLQTQSICYTYMSTVLVTASDGVNGDPGEATLAPLPSVDLGYVNEPVYPVVTETIIPIAETTRLAQTSTTTTTSSSSPPDPTCTSSQGDPPQPRPAIAPYPIIQGSEAESTLGYATIPQTFSVTATSTTTALPSYVTTTVLYTETAVISLPCTTTVPPSGTTPGTVIIKTVGYVTITIPYTGTGRISSPTTTTVPPSGTASGTVIIETPLPTLDCDPFGYLIQNTALYRVNITTGASELIKQVVGDGRNINAMGYNVADNFLYAAIGGAPGNLIRISATGSSVILDSLELSTPVYAGDIDENSQYWITTAGRPWAQIDLRPGSPTFGATVRRGIASLPGQTVIDWAYVPGGGDALYGLGHDAFYLSTTLMRFDRATHAWTALTDFGNIAGMNAWGAVYASDDGFLYGSENTSGQIWRFPLPARGTRAVRVSRGPTSASNDGARCIRAQNL
ncbi:hypothetical protein F4775DRAFT_603668 [Biscogniauxia sp. FL1348]|nr:hypothetical protein F4775DRAFT_603668 [Biscogniauxia sp. FL1348]